MNIISNQVSNYNNYNRVNNSRPAFQGLKGDKLLKQMAECTSDVTTSAMMNEVKGKFGLSKESFVDVAESFMTKIKELTEITPKKAEELRELETKQKNIPAKYNVEYSAEQEVRQQYSAQTAELEQRVNESKTRLLAAKQEASVYEPMKEVKSIEEIGIMMPEDVMKLIDETNAHKNEAAESMFNFLMNNGDGAGVMAQIERYKSLNKAYMVDGLYMIPEVSAHTKGKHAPVIDPFTSSLNLIKMAIKGNPKGSYLESNYIRKQVSDRAMTILKPLSEGSSEVAGEKEIEKKLNAIYDEAVDYHRNFPKGMEKLKKNYPKYELVDCPDGYDTSKSCIKVLKQDGFVWDEVVYDQIAWIGKNN